MKDAPNRENTANTNNFKIAKLAPLPFRGEGRGVGW